MLNHSCKTQAEYTYFVISSPKAMNCCSLFRQPRRFLANPNRANKMSSGFVTEAELADARRKRQEEWEKVRTEDQPEEAPEEEYDSRSLYDRLQEQKNKKDMEYEEAHKLKNMIKTLDDDEVEFLDLVDKNKINAERQAHIEEQKEMNEFRQKVATLQEKRLEEQIQQQISKPKPTKTPIASSRMSQKKILAGVVVKKRKHEEEPSSTSVEEKKPENVTEPAKPEASKATQSGKSAQAGSTEQEAEIRCPAGDWHSARARVLPGEYGFGGEQRFGS
ncbi:PSME3-interacting protein isoform X3 [Culex quinquefasciatus]|uniref:PSME3-interacting protein isoform X3 n=1 Tax=Culex quinquefasciatus TaxID=7176 RepID=UPI0018E378EB|nr:PSME3-interacting protein isoform X3 [Culex quinquefasciatus]